MSSKKVTRIRAPRRGLNNPDNVDFETTWSILEAALREIHGKNASGLSYEELFRYGYKIVLKKRGGDMLDRVQHLVTDILINDVRTSVVQAATPILISRTLGEDIGDRNEQFRADGEKFLRVLKAVYADHTLCMGMYTAVLMYMEKTRRQVHSVPLYQITMSLFRQLIIGAPVDQPVPGSILEVLPVLEAVVLHLIEMERDSETIDRSAIKSCMYMLENLYDTLRKDDTARLYLTSFEPKFLSASREYYAAEGRRLVQQDDAGSFCAQARKRLREEEERCYHTISSLTEPKIKHVVEEELIGAHIRDVMNMEKTGLKFMIDEERKQDLANLFDLNSRIDEKKAALKEGIQKRIVASGWEINNANSPASVGATVVSSESSKAPEVQKAVPDKAVNQATASAIKWVDQVLALKTKYDGIWRQSFRGDKALEKGIEFSFQEFINANPRSSEHLSLFLDDSLKKGTKGKNDAEIEANLDKGLRLLQYIHDKDHFETYYKRHLAKRLLQKRFASMDAERQTIEKMKLKVGNTFTQRLDQMFKDVALSEDLTRKYKSHVSDNSSPDDHNIDLEISILTNTVWPTDSFVRQNPDGTIQSSCIYPACIESVRKRFEHHYLQSHSGRRLTWLPQLGGATVRASFTRPNGKTQRHDLEVSTYAMLILLLFNDLGAGESLTFDEIEAATRIPEGDLIRNLQSLAVANKSRVLKKEPMSKDVKRTDRFTFNESFTSPYLRVKIGVVSGAGNKVENSDERRATEAKVDEERGHLIEAAVVRIMKQRRELPHQQLIAEVITQLANRFQPTVEMIKKRITSLMEREYLERAADSNMYTYLA